MYVVGTAITYYLRVIRMSWSMVSNAAEGQENRDMIVSVSRWHLRDDRERTAELFQWGGVYNRLTG